MAARLLLAIDFLLNGMSWWWKILPYPSISDPHANRGPLFVQAMIDTGYMFDGIKAVEVIAGGLLLVNRLVPLALLIAFPVSVGAWSVDFFLISGSLRAQVMGWSVLCLNGFLLLAYLPYFKTIFVARAQPGMLVPTGASQSGTLYRWCMIALGAVTVALGLVACGWLLNLAWHTLAQWP